MIVRKTAAELEKMRRTAAGSIESTLSRASAASVQLSKSRGEW
jgi:hypothetical protein